MSDDLIGTAAVARRLGVSVATVNRWATDPATSPVEPAASIPGPKRAAAHLYRSADVEAAWERRVDTAIAKGACELCTTFTRQVWHNGDACPNAEDAA